MRLQGLRRAALPWMLLLAAALSQLSLVSAADSYGSLVAAIQAANSSGSGETTLSGDIVLTAALPPITGSLTIDGGGHSISGAEEYRIFDVNGGALTLLNVTLTKGNAETGGAIKLTNAAALNTTEVTFVNNRAVSGGVIGAYGPSNRLIVERSSFIDNRAERRAGVIDVTGGTLSISSSSFAHNRSADYGGVIVSQSGEIRIENSTFYANRAASNGGVFNIFNADLSLSHVTMVNNFTAYGEGDAILNHDGKVNLRNSIVANRSPASDCAGGLDQIAGNFSLDGTCGAAAQGDPLLGGPVGSPSYLPPQDHSPTIDAADPQFCLDRDQLGRPRPYGDRCDIGAIETATAAPAPTPIEPPPPCPLDLRIVAANTDAPAGGCPAGNGHDVITLFQDITLTSQLPVINSDITIEGNGHSISGDGKYRIFRVSAGKLTINNLTLKRAFNSRLNSAGAAIGLEGKGRLEVNHATFIDNIASEGGAIGTRYDGVRFTVNSSHFEGNGASITGGAISMNGGGSGTIANSSFVRNRSDIEGGAIYTVSGAVSVSNSTFTSNRARKGGGALSAENAAVTLTHVTMYNNLSPLGSGVHVSGNGRAAVNVRNSILDRRLSAPVCSGRLSQSVGNFIADGACSPKLAGDPLFDEPVDTARILLLQAGSPAIGAADPRYCLESDQLGRRRPIVGGCDMGAIEMPPVVVDISACLIATTHILNFRDGPGGNVIGSVPRDTTLPVTARTPRWFEVEHDGTTGWISADYVVEDGECG